MIGVRRRDWESLAFRCLDCGIGYSNATNPEARVRIVRDIDQAVPGEVHDGLQAALAEALNVRNRPSKRNAFCSASSEDAVTWTVFRGLDLIGRLARVAQAITPDHPDSREVDLLLWGVPVAGPDGAAIRDQLIAVSDELGEASKSRSEPDVILVTETHVVFIEAKTGSRNDVNASSNGWATYLKDEALFRGEAKRVQEAGYYELVRNWVIGNRLADKLGRDYLLVNLGPSPLAQDVQCLTPLLGTTAHRSFSHLRWVQLLQEAEPLPQWLSDHVDKVGLRSM
jgi:hypothetical protein